MGRFLIALSTVLLLSVLTGSTRWLGRSVRRRFRRSSSTGRASDVEVSFDQSRVPNVEVPAGRVSASTFPAKRDDDREHADVGRPVHRQVLRTTSPMTSLANPQRRVTARGLDG